MTMVEICRPVTAAWAYLLERCSLHFPCLSDPDRRTSVILKTSLVLFHLVIVGLLFVLDEHLQRKTQKEPWYTAIYLVLFVATLVQYFYTSGSTPGYVVDAMRVYNDTRHTFLNTSRSSEQSASSIMGSSISSVGGRASGKSNSGAFTTMWVKQVMALYPQGSSTRTWTCTYCNIVLPPRAKHCHDCNKCVLQFDHHCVWLGTCIGQGNHCRFWWYIFEETVLSIWTIILYISFLEAKTEREWWKNGIAIVFLAILFLCLIFLLLLLIFHGYLILTNQTTYELIRRRRILYLREIPERVHPFSKGVCRNLYDVCCSRDSLYAMEPVPTRDDMEETAQPYTCIDIVSCRCF
ncbi:putative S-acyltransferase [Acorus calamus]|uniref:S-acyltransferase n=1 Tax=Acorus calamus TaxID=4465 RepID=A0AAV9FEW5_ACOCL|nr:putative S-acyltransferase [Acorus calamus]